MRNGEGMNRRDSLICYLYAMWRGYIGRWLIVWAGLGLVIGLMILAGQV